MKKITLLIIALLLCLSSYAQFERKEYGWRFTSSWSTMGNVGEKTEVFNSTSTIFQMDYNTRYNEIRLVLPDNTVKIFLADRIPYGYGTSDEGYAYDCYKMIDIKTKEYVSLILYKKNHYSLHIVQFKFRTFKLDFYA
jgi:hypothetical protein